MYSPDISVMGYPFMAQGYPLCGVMSCRGQQVCIANDWEQASQIARALNVAFAPATPNTILVPIQVHQ